MDLHSIIHTLSPYATHVISGATLSLLGWLAREARRSYKNMATKDFVEQKIHESDIETRRTIDESNEIQLLKINGTYIRRAELKTILAHHTGGHEK